MGDINPGNMLTFQPTDRLFARVRKRLSSFDAVGILDEGDFYYYIKQVIEQLGVSVYEELPILLHIVNHSAALPDNFSYLYAAYSTDPTTTTTQSKQTCFPQEGFALYMEETWQPYRQCKNCLATKFEFAEGQALRTRTYVQGQPNVINWNRPILLRLGPNAKKHCHADSPNHRGDFHGQNAYEISIHNGYLYTNFKEGHVFMKYYAMPLDPESGLPMIPSSTFVEKAIEDYIIYRVIEDMWFNGLVPDMDNRYKMARANSDDSMKSALYYCKLPSFQEAINYIRIQRKNLRIYQQTNFNS